MLAGFDQLLGLAKSCGIDEHNDLGGAIDYQDGLRVGRVSRRHRCEAIDDRVPSAFGRSLLLGERVVRPACLLASSFQDPEGFLIAHPTRTSVVTVGNVP